ncbi:hypothetical protein SAMN05216551_103242 [Chitinasiproducens palmae]|uniref:Uncharacterized protein n=1 Tax=Chitinasiproducens palmae TaxID=1770053 RepID=A0A1H2PML5_9BURK|nr:hypothetical protein SAMN05216551_103242 [Chitinasiproducens palmae]
MVHATRPSRGMSKRHRREHEYERDRFEQRQQRMQRQKRRERHELRELDLGI